MIVLAQVNNNYKEDGNIVDIQDGCSKWLFVLNRAKSS